MQFTANQIAQLIQGKVEGNPDKIIRTFSKIEEATPDSISFIANEKYEKYASDSKAGILIVSNQFSIPVSPETTLIRVEEPYSCLPTLLAFYDKVNTNRGIEEYTSIPDDVIIDASCYIGSFTYISKGVKIGKDVKIFPQSYIGENVEIGDNTIIFPGVKVYRDVKIGNNCTIHSNAVIGSDGFGFAPQADGSFKKIPQTGNVILEDHVEIGANTVIDRASIGSTLIKKGAKLDNLIQIAHNVEIGENTVIAAQAGVSGSTKLGKNVMIGGQAGIVGHIKIANGSKINAQSGVSKSIEEEGKGVTGSPAHDFREMLRAQALMRKLPELLARIEALEKK